MASQFPKPSVVFSGTVNWPQAQTYVKEMMSYINEVYYCRGNKSPVPSHIPFMYLAMTIDAPTDQDNSARWEDDIESLYRILYPYT